MSNEFEKGAQFVKLLQQFTGIELSLAPNLGITQEAGMWRTGPDNDHSLHFNLRMRGVESNREGAAAIRGVLEQAKENGCHGHQRVWSSAEAYYDMPHNNEIKFSLRPDDLDSLIGHLQGISINTPGVNFSGAKGTEQRGIPPEQLGKE